MATIDVKKDRKVTRGSSGQIRRAKPVNFARAAIALAAVGMCPLGGSRSLWRNGRGQAFVFLAGLLHRPRATRFCSFS